MELSRSAVRWTCHRVWLVGNSRRSPGSGKTSLLERTVAELGDGRPVYVVEGDQETSFDADRIERAGARAVQVNTATQALSPVRADRTVESSSGGQALVSPRSGVAH